MSYQDSLSETTGASGTIPDSEKYYWQMKIRLAMDDRWLSLYHCPKLGICRQQVVLKKGYRVVKCLYFFADEMGLDDPTYNLKAILAEVKLRKGLRDSEAKEPGEPPHDR